MSFSVRKTVVAALVVAVVIAAIAVYKFFDPMESSIFPKCVFYSVTGLKCPGCGTQRALHAMLAGNLAAAWHYNAFWVVMLPVIALLLGAEGIRKRAPRLYVAVNSKWVVAAVLVAVVAWWIARNALGW